jgi:parvulin-like peptidyl-prolyl isomerase
MKGALTLVLAAIAALGGTLAGEWLSRTSAAHRLAGRVFHHRELIAMVDHRGIFDGADIAAEVLRLSAAKAHLDEGELRRTMFALRAQFGNESHFSAALRADGIWRWQLRRVAADALRGTDWIVARTVTRVSREEAQRYFEEHHANFMQPARVRARHLFLAAPTGSESLEEKRAAMQEIMTRLQAGEDFASLVGQVSEDEATKSRGGDLGFLAGDRVPEEFWGAIENLPVNAPPTLVQSHLGFHAVQVLDGRAPRAISFEEARPEIENHLAACKRLRAVEKLREQLARQALVVNR